MNNNQQVLLELAQKIAYDKAKQDTMPLNVIKELRATENAHSRILQQILQTRRNSHYIFLESFVDFLGIDIVPQNPVIVCEHNRIDLLIKEPGKYAIIIENKVYDAIDQNQQIDRYFRLTEKIAGAQNTWVIYLSRDGSKTVSENSLTSDTAQKLGTRFLQKNFRDHVLPWLEGEILPNLALKTICLPLTYTCI